MAKRPLTPAQRTELQMMLDLLPLLRADLRPQVSNRLYASDASMKGGGVVYADLGEESTATFDILAETRARRGWHSSLIPAEATTHGEWEGEEEQPPAHVSSEFEKAVLGCPFKTAISTRWRQGDHINILELEAALLSTRHMLRSPVTNGHRVNILIDSTVVIGAVAKGRSSSYRLNIRLRRLAALQLIGNLTLVPHWVPTAINPADKPSRSSRHHG